jgi:hypothetical protein
MLRRKLASLLLALVLALFGVACGGGDAEEAGSEATEEASEAASEATEEASEAESEASEEESEAESEAASETES